MSNKTLAIIIDDFSDRVFEYDNVTLYDYGNYNHITTLKYEPKNIQATER